MNRNIYYKPHLLEKGILPSPRWRITSFLSKLLFLLNRFIHLHLMIPWTDRCGTFSKSIYSKRLTELFDHLKNSLRYLYELLFEIQSIRLQYLWENVIYIEILMKFFRSLVGYLNELAIIHVSCMISFICIIIAYLLFIRIIIL